MNPKFQTTLLKLPDHVLDSLTIIVVYRDQLLQCATDNDLTNPQTVCPTVNTACSKPVSDISSYNILGM